MKERRLTPKKISDFKAFLQDDEKSRATLEKYIRDIRRFADFVLEGKIIKQTVLDYKSFLKERYAVSSANSMIASLNAFLRFEGWYDLCVKQFKVQKSAYSSEEKELTKQEYGALVSAAKNKNNERLSLIIQTICSTGIRVSELQYITVDAVKNGETTVSCKGKTRKIFIVSSLRKKLLKYIAANAVQNGSVFVTRSGKAMDRSNVWKEMKRLCENANVPPSKVFPHNLRHLFARTFYTVEKDIARLADILGHSNINTTRIYIMTTGEEHRRRMENMRLII